MPSHSIEPRRLYRQIAEQLSARIRSREFAVGSRLPAERDLASQLGVSRPSVREALIALELEGLVEVRVGSGVYVVAREPAPSAHRVDAAFGPFEILRAREVLECELASRAARAMTPAQVEGLHAAIAEMERAIRRGAAPIDGDRLFHLRIAEAADNAPLLRMVSELFDERNNPLYAQLGQHFEGGPSWRAAVAEHRAVLAAIEARDARRARSAMQRHLQRSHDRFAASWPLAPGVAPPAAGASAPPSTPQARHTAPPSSAVAPKRRATQRRVEAAAR